MRRLTRKQREEGLVCDTCNDTHMMPLRDAEVMCTHCPVPCQRCRRGGNGAYCERTPCACDCHGAALLEEGSL